MVNKFKSEVFGHHVPMAGIGYVASYPEYRGQGHIFEIDEGNFKKTCMTKIFRSLTWLLFLRASIVTMALANSIYQKEYRFLVVP